MSHHDREGPRAPEQDAAVKRAWQRASDQQPPSQLDAAIIAAARKAAQDRGEQATGVRVSAPSRNWSTRWQPLAAAATVAGLAFILVQSLPRDRDVAPPVQMEEPVRRPATAQEQRSNPSARPTTEDAARKARSSNGLVRSPEPPAARAKMRTEPAVLPPDTAAPLATVPDPKVEATDSRVPSVSPVPVPVPSPSRADDAVVSREREGDRHQAAESILESRAASPEAGAPAQDSSLANAAPLSAADWAASIAALYASGDVTGAADTLRAFRAADPDADTHLPESLRDWARTVE